MGRWARWAGRNGDKLTRYKLYNITRGDASRTGVSPLSFLPIAAVHLAAPLPPATPLRWSPIADQYRTIHSPAMRCSHTRKPFKIRTDAGPNPCLLVLCDQIDDVKAALINCRVMFAIDPESVKQDGKRFCYVHFRPDVDATAVEATLAKV